MTSSDHPLWRKAPTRLLRQPALLAAIAVGAALVAVVATAYPLFLSSSDSELLASSMERSVFTRSGAGIAYRSTNIPFDAVGPDSGPLTQERHDAFVGAASRSPELGPVAESLAAPKLVVSVPGASSPQQEVAGRLFAGTDVLEHVRILSGTEGDGVWLPEYIADPLHARPGATIRLRNGDHEIDVAVDGIYATISTQPADGYWQVWQDQIQVSCVDCALPPQFILASASQLIDLQTRLDDPDADQAWVAPVREAPPLTLDEARALRSFVDDLEDEMKARASHLGLLFPCCGPVATTLEVESTAMFLSQSDDLVRIVEARSAGVRGPALVLLLAGLAIALIVVSAAGVFSHSSRPLESGVLSARGWGPLAVAGKAALESALPVLMGTVTGFGIASGLVAAVGPGGRVASDARRAAIAGALGAATVTLAVMGVAAAVMFVSKHEHKQRLSRVFVWMPWELFAFAALIALGRGLHPAATGGQVSRPGAPVFLYPVTLALAIGILLARVAAVAILLRARAHGGTRVTAPWLAIRRAASTIRLAVVFLIAATLAASVFVSAQSLVSSLRATVLAKAEIFVGSDVQASVVRGASAPPDFPFPLTRVERARDVGTFDDAAFGRFQMLVIDPATFAAAAFWDDALSEVPLGELVARLDDDGDGPVSIVIANAAGIDPSTITVSGSTVPVEVVGRADSFPGASSPAPLVVLSRDSALRTFPRAFALLYTRGSTTELWVRGPTGPVVDALNRAASSALVITADEVRDIPYIVAAVNTFLTLDVLGLMALLLVVVLAVGYLHVRQRPRVVSSGLSARMGVPSSLLRRALVLELGGVLIGAFAIGVPVGIISSAVVLRSLDPLASIPPRPFFTIPWVSVIAGGIALLTASVVGGWLVDRATRRADLGEVMRVAG